MAGFWSRVLSNVVSRLRVCPNQVALPSSASNQFNEVADGYSASGDSNATSDLVANIPRVTFSRIDRGFLGLFGRVVKSAIFTCYQYLFVWDCQLVPPHPMDYAPLLVYKSDNGQRRTVLYDSTHYFRGARDMENNRRPIFGLDPFWHAFWPRGNQDSSARYLSLPITPMCDSHLKRWWGQDDDVLKRWWNIPDDRTPHLKMDKNLKNPFLTALATTNRLDMESPTKTPLLEELAHRIRFPFIASAICADSLEDCLETFRFVLTPHKDVTRNRQARIDLSQIAMIALLRLYNLIELEGTENKWESFSRYLDFPEQISEFELYASVRKFITGYRETSFHVLEGGYEYFNDLKSSISGDNHGPLIGRIKSWHSKSRKEYRKRYPIEWDKIFSQVGKRSNTLMPGE